MNSLQIAAALRVLANAFEADEEGANDATPAPATQKRGRGRQAKGEENGVALPAVGAATQNAGSASPTATTAAATAVVTQTTAVASAADDPFADVPKPLTATLDEVRAALKALAAATTQDKALATLASFGDGAANLTDLKAEKYGYVVAAAVAALPPVKTEPSFTADPFDAPVTAPTEKLPTKEDIKTAVVAAQKRTSGDTVSKVVMDAGGKAADPSNGVVKPSINALPESKYAEVLKALAALPTTK